MGASFGANFRELATGHAGQIVIDERALRLVDRIHEAGLKPACWPAVVDDLRREFSACIGVMFFHRTGDARWSIVGEGIAPEWEKRLRASELTLRDSRFFAALRDAKPGEVAADWMLGPLNELRESRFFREWFAPQGLCAACFVKTAADEQTQGMLSLIRSANADEWDEQDLVQLRFLGPHLAQSLEVSRRLSSLDERLQTVESLLSAEACAALAVDGDARVLYSTERAASLLAAANGLLLVGGKLCAARHDETATMHALIHDAARGARSSGGRVSIHRDGARPLGILVTAARGAVTASHRHAGIFVSIPDDAPHNLAPALCSAYGLTCAEARIAVMMIASDMPLGALAEKLGVSINTVKTQLRSIFAKTSTNRRSELVKLALLSARGA